MAAGCADGLPQRDQFRGLEPPNVNERELLLYGLPERRDAGADGAGSDKDVHLVDQPWARRSFQVVRLPKQTMSPPSPPFGSATRACASSRRTMSVFSFQGAVSSAPLRPPRRERPKGLRAQRTGGWSCQAVPRSRRAFSCHRRIHNPPGRRRGSDRLSERSPDRASRRRVTRS